MNEQQGRSLLIRQAENGDAEAQFQLGLICEDQLGVMNQVEAAEKIQQCIQWYMKAAELHKQAAYNLASIYYVGRVVAQDFKIAYKYFTKSAELKNEQAMFYLGLMFLMGQGVDQDFEKCRGWFEKAANNGSFSAMNNLGNMYRQGIGTPQDIEKARKYYQMAADKGDLCAMTNLASVLLNEQPVSAYLWYEKAALGGFENAMFNVAVLLEEGTGTQKDLKAAMSWYQKAANLGNQEAKDALIKLAPVVEAQKKEMQSRKGCSCRIY